MYYEREPERIPARHAPVMGAVYLAGYADGYYNRPRIIQRTKRAQAAYAKGYQAGQIARPKPTRP